MKSALAPTVRLLPLALSTLLLSAPASGAPATPAPARYAVQSDGTAPVPSIVARDVCAWPAMTRLRDGTLLIANFNRPSHGRMTGDVDTWASTDSGRTWEKRAPGAAHDPGTTSNRMNVAFGALPNGEALLIASGWSLKPDADSPTGFEIDRVLRPWVSRSADSGRTWSVARESFPEFSPAGGAQIPFGPVHAGANGDLLVPIYDHIVNKETGKASWSQVFIYRSPDLGRTWTSPVPLDSATRLNETALLHLGGGRWLAFTRSAHLTTYESNDDGRTWRSIGPATERNCYPANAIVLADGRVLLTFGNRAPGDPRIEAKVSADGGRTWSAPVRLVTLPPNPTKGKLEDMGYPSSIQPPDGNVVTAYYTQRSSQYDGYQLAVVTWDPAKSFPARGRP
jgi:hypothetical protein